MDPGSEGARAADLREKCGLETALPGYCLHLSMDGGILVQSISPNLFRLTWPVTIRLERFARSRVADSSKRFRANATNH